MPGDFFERMAELEAMTPDLTIAAVLDVNQVYAHYQHEGLDLNHPNGGQAKYLEQPWTAAGGQFAERMARGLLEPGGLQTQAERFAENGAKMVYDHAPVEFGDLRESGHPQVEVDGVTTYDRPAIQPRLSEAELREKRRLSGELGPVLR